MRLRFGLLACCALPLLAFACGSSTNDDDGDGDTSSVGGSAGQTPSGGSSNHTGGSSSETGGSHSGGSNAGGTVSGGSSSGGAQTGGTDTGGASTGGSSTGGAETGGTDTGGASTGGVSTGGASTGGADTGGTSSGGNNTGGTGTGGTGATVSPQHLTCGPDYNCSIDAAGGLKCWGFNNAGRLGIGTIDNRGDAANEMEYLPYVLLGTGRTPAAVSAGNGHTCALLDDDSVKCWGYNAWGQLGLGDVTNRGGDSFQMNDDLPAVFLGTAHTALGVEVGASHSCALLDDHSVKCWGLGENGRLGQGSVDNLGDQSGELGNALPAVNLGTGRTVQAITAGNGHTCVLLDDDTIKCWGLAASGQLGTGSILDRGAFASDMGDNLKTVDLGGGSAPVAVVAGGHHTCALLTNGAVKCWGDNGYGQLGLGDTKHRGDGLNEMGTKLPAVSLGSGRTALQLAAGFSHTCALLDDHSVKCWGYNYYGQLGQGDAIRRGDDANEMGDALLPIDLGTGRSAVAISAGGYHTCARLDDNSVKCWGYNLYGQLGLGDKLSRGDEPNEMGDDLPAVKVP